MNDSIFRKKNLDKISSPDSLYNTIKVTPPAIWMILLAIILVLVGFFVWAIFGTLNSTVDTVVVSKNGETGCYVSEDDYYDLKPGMDVIVGTDIYELGRMNDEKSDFAEDVDEYTAYLGDFDPYEYLYYFKVLGNVKEGCQKGQIITEKINAISFLWN